MAVTDQAAAFPYNQVRIVDRHITKCGVIQVPRAGSDGEYPAFIKVHAKYQYRIVDFAISERGAEPEAPAPDPQTGEVLKYANVILEGSKLELNNRTHIVTKRGRYVFLKQDVITVADGYLAYPQEPYDDTKPVQSNAESWISTLIGSDTSGSSSQSTAENGSTMEDGNKVPSSMENIKVP